jgi:hypothetical protein
MSTTDYSAYYTAAEHGIAVAVALSATRRYAFAGEGMSLYCAAGGLGAAFASDLLAKMPASVQSAITNPRYLGMAIGGFALGAAVVGPSAAALMSQQGIIAIAAGAAATYVGYMIGDQIQSMLASK